MFDADAMAASVELRLRDTSTARDARIQRSIAFPPVQRSLPHRLVAELERLVSAHYLDRDRSRGE